MKALAGLREEATEFMTRGFCAVEGVSHPLVVNSFVIRRKMVESGTSEPSFIRDSACMPEAREISDCHVRKRRAIVPSGVRLRTLSLKRSPELMEDS